MPAAIQKVFTKRYSLSTVLPVISPPAIPDGPSNTPTAPEATGMAPSAVNVAMSTFRPDGGFAVMAAA